MDIQQMKSYFKKQNESEKIAKQVRDLIKQTTWQKQDMREGFTETFTPLIQSQDSIKKSIDEQQNKTLEQLRANQLALTDKENKLEKLIATMLAITDGKPDDADGKPDDAAGKPDDADGKPDDAAGKPDDAAGKPQSLTITPDFFDKYINNEKTIKTLIDFGITEFPSTYYNYKVEDIYKKVKHVAKIINDFKQKELVNIATTFTNEEGLAYAKAKSDNPRQNSILLIDKYNELAKYFYQLTNLYKFKKTLKGKGIKGLGMTYYNTPLQLLDRLELLGASIIAGNNGVIPEFSEIVHQLAKMSVITKSQLDELLKNYVLNR